jgi:hypothetical protein
LALIYGLGLLLLLLRYHGHQDHLLTLLANHLASLTLHHGWLHLVVHVHTHASHVAGAIRLIRVAICLLVHSEGLHATLLVEAPSGVHAPVSSLHILLLLRYSHVVVHHGLRSLSSSVGSH